MLVRLLRCQRPASRLSPLSSPVRLFSEKSKDRTEKQEKSEKPEKGKEKSDKEKSDKPHTDKTDKTKEKSDGYFFPPF